MTKQANVYRVSTSLIGKRLDAEFYQPKYVQNEARLTKLPFPISPLGTLIRDGRRTLYMGTDTLEREQAPESWVGFITSDDLSEDGFFVDCATRRWVHPEFATKYSSGKLRANELLVKVKGPNQLAAFVGEIPSRTTLVSGTIWGALFKKTSKHDPQYVVAVLMSHYGQLARTRMTSNTNVEFVSPTELLGLGIPSPNEDAQAYIGNKVRQAETLRARAKEAERQFTETISEEISRPDKRAKFSRVTAGMLVGDLNPGRFDPDRLEVRNRLLANGGRPPSDFARIITNNVDDYPRSQRYLGLDGISSSSIDITFETAAEADANGTSRKLLEGAVLSKLRPYLNKVGYISSEGAGAIGSTELLCVQSDEVHGGYIYGVLKLETTTRQLNPISTGATLPRIGSADVLDVIVPWSDDHAVWGQRLAGAQFSYTSAKRLTIAARLLVEALIEQKVTEAELIATHKDPERDRELLARLTTKGLDVVDAPPLFPDLDALFELLSASDEGEADA
ncbi:MAG TPA: hypothetical protein PLR25_23765 [Planctomycetaceae bacterium]|nr:hypothetical protein [Planctomycetaceae bacterium]